MSKLNKRSKNIFTVFASMGVALTLGFSVFLGVSCNKTPNNTTDPSNPNNPSNPTQPVNPSNPSNPSNPTDKEYCGIIEDIFASDYYSNLWQKPVGSVYEPLLAQPHPFAFLESKGHNIKQIMSSNLVCESLPYILGEDTKHLYVDTRVESTNSKYNYYTFYTLKYSISDKEYSDFYEFAKNKKLEASFFVQELSAQRNPEVLSEVRLDRVKYDEILKRFAKYSDLYYNDVFGTDNVYFSIVSFNKDSNTVKGKFRTKTFTNAVNQDIIIREADMFPTGMSSLYLDNNNVLTSLSTVGFATETEYNAYKNNSIRATAFELSKINLYATQDLYTARSLTV